MRRTDVIVIGGGQAGLAMSRCLLGEAIDHVVLERGRIGERWHSERWDSLRLLTPSWQSRLPGGWRYEGPDPDGYMTMPQVIEHLERYARSFAAPVETGTEVRLVAPANGGYRVATPDGAWWAPNVVVATGHCDTALVPATAAGLAPSVHQLVPGQYRNPAGVPDGGVLVVGASASGVQIAAELRRAGRPVTLAVGRHTRLPRRYRGRDILWWLEVTGVLGQRVDELPDAEAARRQPSFQLAGTDDGSDLDLGVLQGLGVRLAGRVCAIDGQRVIFAGDLRGTTSAADARLERTLARLDAAVDELGLPADPPAAIARVVPRAAPARMDLAAEGFRTVVWATGFRPRYPWLAVPVLDDRGEIAHLGGVTRAPGLYVLGLRLLRTRKSTFIDGVGDDANVLARHIAERLRRPARRAA